MRSVMKHRFSEVPSVEIPRSRFNRSHAVKTTFDAGGLVPILVDHAIPGDTFRCNMTGFARLSTPTYPVMDNLYMDTFFFAIPYRLIWDNWKKFCGEQTDPGDSIDYTIPQVTLNDIQNESLYDYFGLPTRIAANYTVNNLVGRAHNLTYNEWFRDQNLQDSLRVDTDDGPDTIAFYNTVRKRCKRHDYFTSCLPWLQKGDAVLVALGTEAPIFGDNMDFDQVDDSSNQAQVRDAAGTSANLRRLYVPGSYVTGSNTVSGTGELKADLSAATGPTVNQLREAIQIQRFLEKDARSGTRYTEIVQSHFGVTSPDARMQRPEYLGGGSTPVVINPVARTDSSPGTLGAVGTAAFSNHGFVKSFTEHCVILGFVNVRADLTYQEGIDRHWDYQTRYDLYWPVFAHLGEQAVLNREIFVDAATLGAGTDDDVFGYQERYAEMRYKNSKITGKFRSNDAATLDAWHLGIEFGSQPTLDTTFIQEDPPIDRVIATPTEPHFIFDSYISFDCVRPMPTYSIPGLIDHF